MIFHTCFDDDKVADDYVAWGARDDRCFDAADDDKRLSFCVQIQSFGQRTYEINWF